MNELKLSLATIQGITDHVFRALFAKHFNGVDAVYTPFIRLQNDGTIKKSQLKDIAPENNTFISTVPQVLVNSGNDFIYLSKLLIDYGFKEINLNMGCPYPMVANRKLGSGLLPFPGMIKALFDEVFEKVNAGISVKMRTGYADRNEISEVLPVLNSYPLSEIIIHPRIGRQMYTGKADYEWFEHCKALTVHSLAYNGDIDSVATFHFLSEKLKGINSWMIGRTAISNPFIFEEIKSGKNVSSEKKMERFAEFHNGLIETYSENLSGPGHLLTKMLGFWEYFSLSFSNSKKVYKKIKKAKSVNQYNSAIYEIFNEEIYMV